MKRRALIRQLGLLCQHVQDGTGHEVYEVTATGELVTVRRHAMIIEHLARRILKIVGLPWMGKDP